MALLRAARGLVTWAVVDSWELRGVGRLPARDPAAVRLALEAVVHQTRPTVLMLVASGTPAPVSTALHAVARRHALPLLRPTKDERRAVRRVLRDTFAEVLTTFPELASVADRRLRNTALLARVALFTLSIPPRSYVSRLASSSPAPLGSARPRRARPA